MYYFYIIRSLKNKKLYLGSTPDLKERLKSHNNAENKATKPNIPYELIFYSGFKNKKDAINYEQYFKTTAGWKRIHKMLENTLSDNSVYDQTYKPFFYDIRITYDIIDLCKE